MQFAPQKSVSYRCYFGDDQKTKEDKDDSYKTTAKAASKEVDAYVIKIATGLKLHNQMIQKSPSSDGIYTHLIPVTDQKSLFRHRGNSLIIEGDFKAFWQWLFFYFT